MKHIILCRWCGGKMKLHITEHFGNGASYFYWTCPDCQCSSKSFKSVTEALAWVQQPIPWMSKDITDNLPDFLYENAGDIHIGRHADVICTDEWISWLNKITNSLAVKEEEK